MTSPTASLNSKPTFDFSQMESLELVMMEPEARKNDAALGDAIVMELGRRLLSTAQKDPSILGGACGPINES